MVMASCRREENLKGDKPEAAGQDIYFTVSNAQTPTRSSEPENGEYVLHAEGRDTMYLCTSVEDMTGTATKGHVTTTENLTSFYASAYLNNGQAYFKGLKVDKDDDGYAYTGKYWPGYNLNFFAHSHLEDDLVFHVANDGECSGTFSYTLPAPDPTAKKDAAAQPDYVFAIAADRENDGNAVELELRHSFSAICVKIGSMESENRIVNHVALKNAVSSGNCSFGLDANGVTSFVWSGQSGSKTYIQTIERAVDNGSIINDDGIIFMMVPHTLTDVELEISFTLHHGTAYEHEYTITKKLADYTTEWLADKKYVYTVSASEEVEVEITDQVTASVKSDVQITSKGISPSYIRAAIIGYWVNNEGNIVSDWKETDGEFDWGADWDSHWVKHTDGFYYHLEALEQGEKTWPLFETYTLTYEHPITDAHLELHIATQAVIHHKVGEAWPGCPMDK